MKSRHLIFILSLLLMSNPALARVEPGYSPDRTGPLTLMYGDIDQASQKADLDFIKGMKPHHAGALTMAKQYLANQGAKSPVLMDLAKGIMHNQTFEIGMLASVKTLVEKPITPENTWRPLAAQGLAQQQKFIYAPMPNPFGIRTEEVSATDVAFAKGMIVHHQGAVDMAHAYLDNPNAKNEYLRLMCNDIITDQSQEIALMQDIIKAYGGDADKVKPAKIYGMEHMGHSGHKMHH